METQKNIKTFVVIIIAIVLNQNLSFAQAQWRTNQLNSFSGIQQNRFGTANNTPGQNRLDIRFFTRNAERMRLMGEPGFNLGFLGIGTTAPQSLLHLNRAGSTALFTQWTNGTTGSGSANDGLLIGINFNGEAQIFQQENNWLDVFTNTTNTLRMRIWHDAATNEPRVGIGSQNHINTLALIS